MEKRKRVSVSFANYENKQKVNSWSVENVGTPDDHALCSNKKFKFICFKCNHSFSSTLNSISGGHWCGYCSGNIVCGDKECVRCYEKTFEFNYPEMAKEWSQKNILKPHQVLRRSTKKYFFDCRKCGHEYHTVLARGCIYCANRTLCDKDCQKCYEKTFEFHSPEMAKEWSQKNILRPYQVFNRSNKKYFFDCRKCGHEYHTILNNHGCIYCANKKLCGKKECLRCYEKTFEFHFPEQSREWSEKNVLKPHQVFKTSHDQYLFDCRKCGHEYHKTLSSGHGCKYCANQAMCETPNCKMCYEKSFKFLSPIRSQEWSDKNTKGPHQVFNETHKKAFFNCSKCKHEYFTRIQDSSDKIGGGCPHCHMFKNKSMNLLCQTLDKVENITYKTEIPVKIEGRNLRWDMVIQTRFGKIHVESDGGQHFSEKGMIGVSRGHSAKTAPQRFKKQREHDLLKESHIRATGGLLYRFSYRQRNQIPEFVTRMLKDVVSVSGVVYLDSLYDDWGVV